MEDGSERRNRRREGSIRGERERKIGIKVVGKREDEGRSIVRKGGRKDGEMGDGTGGRNGEE